MKTMLSKPTDSLAGLGRRFARDDDDKKFMLARPKAAELITSRYWLSRGAILDQGGTSECVIYAADKWLTTHPVSNKSFGAAADRTRVYKEVQALDEWEGDSYDGTSVRAMFKWLKAKGLCSEYRWAFDLETVVAHLLAVGPMEVGTNWYMDMFMPDSNGYIWPTGGVAGGHGWVIHGVNRLRKNPDGTKGAARMIQSYGSGWGQKGKAWLTFSTLDQLIAEDGEAGVALETKLAA